MRVFYIVKCVIFTLHFSDFTWCM